MTFAMGVRLGHDGGRYESAMTLVDAAASLGVQPDTLRRQIRLGKLQGRKLGPIWTVTLQEVERYRRENQR